MEDEKELLAKIKSQTEDFLKTKGFTTKTELDAAVVEKMKAFEGLDALKLKSLFDEKTGIFAVLKAQGDEITALKEQGGETKKKSFESMLNEKMADAEKIFKAKSGSLELSLKVAAVMTTDNTISTDTLPQDLIESFSEGAFVAKRQPREYVYDVANVTTVSEIDQYKTWLEEGDEQGAFAVVAEGGLKPLVSTALVRNHSEYRKVAGKYVVTEEFSKFRKKAYAIIKRLLEQKMLRDKAAILTTSLLADAAPYVSSALDGQYTEPTDYHAIAAVAAQIEALNFAPDLLVLNPQDKWRIGMLQGTDGHFYLTIPQNDPTAGTRLMGFVVRTSNQIPVGNFILGEAGLWEIEQEGISVRMGYGMTVTGGTSNGGGNVTDVQGDLDHNRFRVIVENYFHNYIATNNEGSFVYADFDTVKEAITAEA